jgi:hypothetical protein
MATAWTSADSASFDRIQEIDLALEHFASDNMVLPVVTPRLHIPAVAVPAVLPEAEPQTSDEEEQTTVEEEAASMVDVEAVLEELAEIEEELNKVMLNMF